ncbi:MAG: c-type cytochrome [Candidatus Brocadiales bacterium]|nr:c-type cytochrome [Candidatus Bathyanammoxibius sp.]
MRIITGFLVSLLCCFVFSGTVFSAVSLAAETKKVDAGRIFNNNCAKCHGKSGGPTKRGRSLGSPSFSSRFWQVSITDKQIIESITYGRNKMPGWRKELTPEEIKAAARWVRVLGKKRR